MVPAEIAHVDGRENDVPILREAIEHELRVTLEEFGACASTTFGVPAAGRRARDTRLPWIGQPQSGSVAKAFRFFSEGAIPRLLR